MLNYKEPPKDYYSIFWVQSRLQFLTKAFIYFPVGSGSMFKFIFCCGGHLEFPINTKRKHFS